MEYTLSLKEKFDFLWNDFLDLIKERIETGALPENFRKNIKKMSKRDVNGFSESAENFPDCMSCTNICCSRITGHIPLTLSDVAVLVDQGLEEGIKGNFQGMIMMLEKYLDTGDESVFNIMNMIMVTGTNEITYKPVLKKNSDNSCIYLKENRCSIYKYRPISCREFPYVYQHDCKEIGLKDDCQCFRQFNSENEKNQVTKTCLEYENELIRDISMLMLNKEALAAIGFEAYLNG